MSDQRPACPDDCPKKRWVSRLLVCAQFVLVTILLVMSIPVRQGWTAWAISAIGITLGLWAIITMGRFTSISPRLKDNAPLRIEGPYRLVRHPMYLGLLIFCGAYLVDNFNAFPIALWLALFFVLACKIYYEEQILQDRFPGYASYAKKTKRILPFVF